MDRNETKQLPNGKTLLVNSCGHEFAYNIRKASAVQWLQARPCPSCARKGKGGKESPKLDEIQDKYDKKQQEPMQDKEIPQEPKQENVPEPSEDEILAVLENWPNVPNGMHHKVFVDVMLLVDAALPVWLQGPPGTSKSTVAEQIASALGLPFHPIACHEMMSRTDLFGYTDAVGTDHRTPLWEAYEHGGVLLLDEVDNGNPNLLAALNSALSNGHCVFGSGTVVAKHDNFRVVATANTAGLGPESGFIGRNGVDAATRDRFVTVMMPIDDKLEAALAFLHAGDKEGFARTVNECVKSAETQLKSRAKASLMAPKADRVLDVVRKVRQVVDIRYRGTVLSPRATIHATTMVCRGFTIAESMHAKLPGVDVNDVKSILAEVGEK